MPVLYHIVFDNVFRLEQDEYLFEYNGVPFKLIQNDPRRASDVLLTIVSHENGQETEAAYAAAGEFLSAVSWENRSPVLLRPGGGIGMVQPGGLQDAQCRYFGVPEIAVAGNCIGNSISRLPKISTAEQRTALALVRDGRSSNVASLAFLYFWQALEVKGERAKDVVNRQFAAEPKRYFLPDYNAKALGLNNRSLGDCLLEDYRHAVAHIRRDPGRRPLILDNLKEIERFNIARRLAEDMSEVYIRTHLNIQEPVWLTRVRGHQFPVYVDEAFMRANFREIVHD